MIYTIITCQQCAAYENKNFETQEDYQEYIKQPCPDCGMDRGIEL